MSQYVRYLVCYDIPDNKVRRNFASELKNLGLVPLQESVFYGDLKPAEARALARAAAEMLDGEVDKCFWFPCRLDVEAMRACVGYSDFTYEEPDGHGFL